MVEPNPTLYLSHGAPDILLRETSAKKFLTELGSHLQDPTAIVVVSAHWIDDPVGITVGDRLNTIHDFGGFPKSLYEMSYPAMGSDSLSAEIGLLLSEAKIESRPVKGRGLDHGVWIPLRLIYPEAQIPVIQVSLPAVTLKELVSFGEALVPLRERGVLIIGSGGSVHNLRALNRLNHSESWAVDFEAWLKESVEQNHFARLISSDQYPHSFQQAHPTIEHFAPLIVAWSAAGSNQPGVRIHHSFDYGNIGMSMFAFGEHREI